MATYFNDPLQVLDYVHDKLDFAKGEIGLAFVGYGEERLIPEYPATLVAPGPVTRDWHGTHTWKLFLMLEIWIYHAKLSESHRTRTRNDLKLVAGVRQVLHSDLRLRNESGEEQCAGALVNAEDPAFIRRPRNEAVVGTRLEFTVESRERFK